MKIGGIPTTPLCGKALIEQKEYKNLNIEKKGFRICIKIQIQFDKTQ